MSKEVIIIGGGFSGLATAALLAKDGFKVKLFEKNKKLGGRAMYFERDGYFFDMGPSWYMMPEVFERFFESVGKDINKEIDLKKLESHYKIWIEDRAYNIVKDRKKNLEEFEKNEKGAGEALEKYLKRSEYIYINALKELVYLDYDNPLKLLKPSIFFKLFEMNLFETFHNYIARQFKNRDLQKVLEFVTVFLGGSPYNTPAFYSLISHTDLNMDIFYPMGGIYTVITAMERICREFGVEIHMEEPITELLIENGKTVGIKTEKGEYRSDLVINSSDMHFFETKVLPEKYQSYPQSYWNKAVMSPSAFNIYLGLDTQIPNIEHHNLFFSETWDEHFKEVYENPTWPDTPSYYFHVPSKSDPKVAPKDGETVFILVPVAPGLKDDEKSREEFAEKVLDHFSNLVKMDVRKHIKVKQLFSHSNYEKIYNAYKGSAFGLAHTLFQTAIFRPLNRSKKIKNLYYVGQYTNPGVGMPIALLSAEIVRRMVNKDFGEK